VQRQTRVLRSSGTENPARGEHFNDTKKPQSLGLFCILLTMRGIAKALRAQRVQLIETWKQI
jgi:hypothetical protein